MHLTLKQQGTRPAGANFLQQQARFDSFIEEFNNETSRSARHEMPRRGLHAIAAVLRNGIPEPDLHPFHDRTLLSSPVATASACTERKSISPKSLAGRGSRHSGEVENGIWLISFMRYDLGYIDLEERTLQTLENPFGAHPAAADSSRDSKNTKTQVA